MKRGFVIHPPRRRWPDTSEGHIPASVVIAHYHEPTAKLTRESDIDHYVAAMKAALDRTAEGAKKALRKAQRQEVAEFGSIGNPPR